ncbi:Chaperone protein HtpG [Candidatus Karelsulcia muelleri]|uniref:Chaperone protein HtpG n=2 Tax=Candidatus Karelsulcia muelleri TaxID=336810 RepID=A0A346E0T6_9FLAO|nr:Chaperone protein HtpG [Candidatus Karelsulcia muelleri]
MKLKMEKNKGHIKVAADNIFPIIKKFLYSENEIFLREIICNAVDACNKIRTLKQLGKITNIKEKLEIEVKIYKEEKIIKIIDNGIGMTKKEVEKYINQIAFSSAGKFLEKYKAQNTMIGNFGLGFYSSFLISDKVEIITKSYKKKTNAVHWICDGSTKFSIQRAKTKKRGTTILLHVNEKLKEFLEGYRILGVLEKYCRFLPIPIKFKNKIINIINPLWKLHPMKIKEKEYKKFYYELFNDRIDEPLLWIHLNIDHPFKLTGILYVPKLINTITLKKQQIHLYQNQVFVTDNLHGIVPYFLKFLKGIIDSPDITLNVSRSQYKNDITLKKIYNYITLKIADKLTKILLKNRKYFEKIWKSIKLLIEYGMISEQSFYEKSKKFALFYNTDGKYYLFSEFFNLIKKKQLSKENKIICFYASNLDEQSLYIDSVLAKGYKILLLDSPFTVHLIQKIEMENNNIKFIRVDSQNIDNIFSETKNVDDINELKELKKELENHLDNTKFTIQIEQLKDKNLPFLINIPEIVRRINEINLINNFEKTRKNEQHYNLIVNTNNKIIKKILKEKNKYKELLIDSLELILFFHNILPLKKKKEFLKRILNNIFLSYKTKK